MKTDFDGFDFRRTRFRRRKTQDSKWLGIEVGLSESGERIQRSAEDAAELQPGPLAGKISYFAPVSLFFFFFLISFCPRCAD